MTPLDLLKWTGGPGSIQLLLILSAVGIWLHYRRPRCRLIARAILGATGLTYWILATPVTAIAVEGLLQPRVPDVALHDSRFDTVVVLALVAGVIGSIPLLPAMRWWRERNPQATLWSAADVASTAALATILLVSCMALAAGTYNPFIYYRF